MTQWIAHRINSIEELSKIPVEYGVEIDIRDHGERLILQHDPYKDREVLDPFLSQYRHGTLILNVKSERIEFRILELLAKYSITDYFFLDSTFPMMIALSQLGETRMAIRFSEFEGMDTLRAMVGKADWVWIDCFSHLPINFEIMEQFRDWGYKTCVVSPDLQGRPEDIGVIREQLAGLAVDAICTKYYNVPQWKMGIL